MVLYLNSSRWHRAERPDSTLLVVGIPNVGKSSLINKLRSDHLKVFVAHWKSGFEIWIRWEADLHQLVPNQGGRNQPLRKFGYILTLVQTNITWPRWVTSLWCICLTPLAYPCHTSPTCMWEWRYQIHCESSVNTDLSIFQLAICATLKDELVGVKFISDYLLWWGFDLR